MAGNFILFIDLLLRSLLFRKPFIHKRPSPKFWLNACNGTRTGKGGKSDRKDTARLTGKDPTTLATVLFEDLISLVLSSSRPLAHHFTSRFRFAAQMLFCTDYPLIVPILVVHSPESEAGGPRW